MNDENYYLTEIRWDRTTRYFFWYAGGDSHDGFYRKGNGKIYSSLNRDDAEIYSVQNRIRVSFENSDKFDFDEVWKLLSFTKKIKFVSKEGCAKILNAWNLLEDFAKTLNISFPPYAKSNRRTIQEIYERIFFLADILDQKNLDLGEGSLTTRERAITRGFLSRIWKLVCIHFEQELPFLK